MRISDWSLDVCSSDLDGSGPGMARDQSRSRQAMGRQRRHPPAKAWHDRAGGPSCLYDGRWRDRGQGGLDRKSVLWGKSVSGRVDLGGGTIIKKNTLQTTTTKQTVNITRR